MLDSGFMGMVFNNVQHFPDLWVWLSRIFNIFRIYGYGFFGKINLLVSIFRISESMGMIFRKFSGFLGILFRKFSGFMGVTFTI